MAILAKSNLSRNVKTIPRWPATTVDADGVALAAIQGLNQKLDEKGSRIRELEAKVSELKKLVNQIVLEKANPQ